MSLKFTDLDGPDTNGHNVYSAVTAAVKAGLPMPAGFGVNDVGTAFVRLHDETDRLVWARRLAFHGVVAGRWGTRWVALSVASAAELADTITVTVRDHSREPAWGQGLTRPHVRRVEISARCPRCGGPRGERRGMNQCDDGAFYWVQVWDNPCGHLDRYENVVREADALQAALDRAAAALVAPARKPASEYVISHSDSGAVRIRAKSPDQSVPFGGELLGFTRPLAGGWIATWRNRGEQRHTEQEAAADSITAEALLFDRLNIDPSEVVS